jgi:glycosyltransferase involved in cell wall biosynthesis
LGIPAHKCLLFPLGIDSQKIVDLDFSKERSRLRKQYSFSNKDFVFLSVAAINHQKNLLGSIKAFHFALEYCPQAKFVLVGPAYERKLLAEIKRYIKRNRLETDIIYAGKVPEAFSYYAMADAFITASFFEGGPLVLLEALASGLPIVTTDVGFAGLFKDRKGIEIVAPPEDIFSFSGSINDLSSSQDFERKFAMKLISTYNKREKPVLPEGFIKLIDKRKAYEQYLYFINQLVNSSEFSEQAPNKSWMSLM